MALWVNSAFSLKGSSNDLFADGLGAHVEEESQEDNDDSHRDEPSSGGAVICLPVVSDQTVVSKEVGFPEESIDVEEARRH